MPAPTPLISWLRCPRCERQPVGQVLRDLAQTTAAPYHYGLRCHVRVVGTGDTPEAAEAAAVAAERLRRGHGDPRQRAAHP